MNIEVWQLIIGLLSTFGIGGLAAKGLAMLGERRKLISVADIKASAVSQAAEIKAETAAQAALLAAQAQDRDQLFKQMDHLRMELASAIALSVMAQTASTNATNENVKLQLFAQKLEFVIERSQRRIDDLEKQVALMGTVNTSLTDQLRGLSDANLKLQAQVVGLQAQIEKLTKINKELQETVTYLNEQLTKALDKIGPNQ